MSDYDREAIVVLNLNVRGKPINASITSLGTLNSSIAHPREVFKTSILSNAASIILMHNHPSGDCTPSRDDIDMTERMYMCGQILGIEVFREPVTANCMKKLSKEFEEEPEM